jgi:serine/threonine-protein kinase RsbW
MIWTFERKLDATGRLLAAVDEFLERHDITGRSAFAARLVAEELFANLVRHNRGGHDRIEVSLRLAGDRLVLRLRDFDVDPAGDIPTGTPDVDSPLDERRPGGLGLHFVRNLFDSLSYDRSDRTLSVTATRKLGRMDVQHLDRR